MSLQCTRPFPTLPNWTGEGKERGPLATKQLAEWQKLCSWRQTSQQEKPLLLLKCITQMLVILYAVLFRCIRLGKHKHTLSLSLLFSHCVISARSCRNGKREERETMFLKPPFPASSTVVLNPLWVSLPIPLCEWHFNPIATERRERDRSERRKKGENQEKRCQSILSFSPFFRNEFPSSGPPFMCHVYGVYRQIIGWKMERLGEGKKNNTYEFSTKGESKKKKEKRQSATHFSDEIPAQETATMSNL